VLAANLKEFLERHYRALVVLLLAVNLLISITSIREKSLTYDEATYIALGKYIAETRDVRAVAAPFPHFPSLVNGLFWYFLKFDPVFWESLPRLYANGYQSLPVIFESGYDPDVLIFLARLPIILIFPFLGLLVFSWSREIFGLKAAFVALILALFCPNLIAHARLATTDFITSVTIFASLYFFRKYLQARSPGGLIICGIFTGLALMSKFTSIILLPVYLVLVLIHAEKDVTPLSSVAKNKFSAALLQRKGSVAGIFRVFLILFFALLTIWAGYLFEYRALYIPQYVASPERGYGGLMKLLYDHHVRIPAVSYLITLYNQMGHQQLGHESFLFGITSSGGRWFYFPLAFLIKVPIPTIILLIISILSFRNSAQKRELMFLLIPVVVLAGAAAMSNVNIGIRLILPVFPFIFVWISRISTIRPFRSYKYFLAALLVWYVGSNFHIYPHYLEYFNELIGGPKNGYKYLVDSNLDWGQDLKLLNKYVEQNDIRPLKIAYFGTPGLAEQYGYYNSGGDCSEPSEGYMAISATFLHSLYVQPGCYDWLKKYEPIDRIAYSIFIYKFPARQP